jgi:hypothetical protein
MVLRRMMGPRRQQLSEKVKRQNRLAGISNKGQIAGYYGSSSSGGNVQGFLNKNGPSPR